MTWITLSDADKPILEEIEKQTDRAAALIATSYLEDRLVEAIKARTVRDQNVEKDMFRNSGPLGSFSAKIDLGFMLGLYDGVVRKMLHTVRDIRNEFAHVAQPRDFNSQRIADLCKNISISLDLRMKNKTTGQTVEFKLDPDGSPRTAFMNAIKYLLLVAEMETKHLPLRTPPAPLVASPQPAAASK
jgi:hypothetical protein